VSLSLPYGGYLLKSRTGMTFDNFIFSEVEYIFMVFRYVRAKEAFLYTEMFVIIRSNSELLYFICWVDK